MSEFDLPPQGGNTPPKSIKTLSPEEFNLRKVGLDTLDVYFDLRSLKYIPIINL